MLNQLKRSLALNTLSGVLIKFQFNPAAGNWVNALQANPGPLAVVILYCLVNEENNAVDTLTRMATYGDNEEAVPPEARVDKAFIPSIIQEIKNYCGELCMSDDPKLKSVRELELIDTMMNYAQSLMEEDNAA